MRSPRAKGHRCRRAELARFILVWTHSPPRGRDRAVRGAWGAPLACVRRGEVGAAGVVGVALGPESGTQGVSGREGLGGRGAVPS